MKYHQVPRPNPEVKLMTLKEITGRKAANDDLNTGKEDES